MSYLVSLKVVRLLLAVSVSVWLAGGCLLGCSKTAMASSGEGHQSSETAVEGESCHTVRSHDCCAKKPEPAPQPIKKPVKQSSLELNQTKGLATLGSMPRGMMNDCPLVVNATAVTSKNNSNSPDSTYATNATFSLISNKDELSRTHLAAPLVPNRGPTYLRCCVFRI